MNQLDLLAFGLPREAAVGFSDKRTPVKHNVFRAHSGRELAAAPYAARKLRRRYAGHLVVDQTAGDAVSDGRAWQHGSSPAILAMHGARLKNLRIRLRERDPMAFDRLAENLGLHLPSMRYEQTGEGEWRHRDTGSTITTVFGDAREERFSDLMPDEWLYVVNDPNNMVGWTLPSARLVEMMMVERRMVSFMSTMGCNPGGLKRIGYEDERRRWGDEYVGPLAKMVAGIWRLDLLLFEILRDDAQWAYLQLVPRQWSSNSAVSMSKAFRDEQLSVACVSLHDAPRTFDEMCLRLFTTKRERGEK